MVVLVVVVVVSTVYSVLVLTLVFELPASTTNVEPPGFVHVGFVDGKPDTSQLEITPICTVDGPIEKVTGLAVVITVFANEYVEVEMLVVVLVEDTTCGAEITTAGPPAVVTAAVAVVSAACTDGSEKATLKVWS